MVAFFGVACVQICLYSFICECKFDGQVDMCRYVIGVLCADCAVYTCIHVYVYVRFLLFYDVQVGAAALHIVCRLCTHITVYVPKGQGRGGEGGFALRIHLFTTTENVIPNEIFDFALSRADIDYCSYPWM